MVATVDLGPGIGPEPDGSLAPDPQEDWRTLLLSWLNNQELPPDLAEAQRLT